jgi:hypothetical protein
MNRLYQWFGRRTRLFQSNQSAPATILSALVDESVPKLDSVSVGADDHAAVVDAGEFVLRKAAGIVDGCVGATLVKESMSTVIAGEISANDRVGIIDTVGDRVECARYHDDGEYTLRKQIPGLGIRACAPGVEFPDDILVLINKKNVESWAINIRRRSRLYR